MKTLKLPIALALGVTLLAVTGCNTVSTTLTQAIGGPKFAPSNPAYVQILGTEPTRTNVSLGEIQAEPTTESVPASDIETALKKEAAKLGADAFVIVADRT